MAGALTGAFPALTEGEVEGEESSLANSCTNACAATSTLDDSPCHQMLHLTTVNLLPGYKLVKHATFYHYQMKMSSYSSLNLSIKRAHMITKMGGVNASFRVGRYELNLLSRYE